MDHREKHYALKHVTYALLEKLEQEGVSINWTQVVDGEVKNHMYLS